MMVAVREPVKANSLFTHSFIEPPAFGSRQKYEWFVCRRIQMTLQTIQPLSDVQA
jgi:hypothetical protein